MNEQELLDLVVSWAQSRDAGRPVAVEELCRGRDDLAREVRARISVLEQMTWLSEYDPAEDDAVLSLPRPRAAIAGDALVNDADLSADELRRRLLASGLIAAEQLSNFEQELSPSEPIRSALALAQGLVQRQLLTPFQMRSIAAGRGQPLVLGNYVIVDKLGQGGMGQVFRARHQRMDRLVALKILPEHTLGLAGTVERFHREVKAAARLTHPNIVTAYDADEARGTHFLVMELVDGVDLQARVGQQGPLTIGAALDCLLQVGRGLDYAHRQGIVHRDIKPANLLIDKQGQVRILDMGLARLSQTDGQGAMLKGLTADGTVLGTVDYMAPEQAASTQSADARSDIYSLGCTLHFLLTGHPPFPDGDTLLARMLAHRDGSIPNLASARPDAPPCLVRIFERCLAKQPADRFESVPALIEAVIACQAESQRDQASLSEPVPLQVPAANRETSSIMLIDTAKLDRPTELAPQVALAIDETDDRKQATDEKLPEIAPSEASGNSGYVIRIGLGLSLLALVVLAGVIYAIQTDQGTLVVEISDKAVAARLIEHEDGRFEMISPAKFHERTNRVLLRNAATAN